MGLISLCACFFTFQLVIALDSDLPTEYVDRKLKIVGMNQAIATTFNLCKESWISALTQS
jgi:hypothetical protein